MGIKITRKKKRVFLLSAIYGIQKLIPLNKRGKLKLFLNLEWIFERLAHETSFRVYPNEIHPYRLSSKEFIIDEITEKDKVLDLGCGIGFLSSQIASKAQLVVGVDHNANSIKQAQKNHQAENLTFICDKNADFLDDTTEDFDILILSHILEHIENPEEFLNQTKKNFSKIYIEVPDFDKTYMNRVREDLKLRLKYSDDDHVFEFDREDLHQLLQKCKLSIDKEEYRFGVMKIWCTQKRQ